MKAHHWILVLAISTAANTAFAQAPATKPPIGVPADAKPFNGKWYRVYLEKVPWHRAREKCTALGGQLAIVPDEPTWEFLTNLSPAILWLGATDERTEGVWLWVDGTPMTFTAWHDRQPDNMGGNEHYIVSYQKRWNDVPKHGNFGPYHAGGFICEWKAK